MNSLTLPKTLATIQQQLTCYAYSTWLTFGIIGCVLNLVILSRRQLRLVSCYIYFLASTVSMLISLCFGIGSALYTIDHVDPRISSTAFCKARTYILQSSFMMSRWLIVAACIDRYTSTSVNARLRKFSRAHVAYRIVMIITLLWVVIPIHILILYEVQSNVCGIFSSTAAALYHSIYTMVFGGFFPILIMTICAIGIQHNLTLKRQRRQRQQNGALNDEQRMRNEYQQRLRDQQVLSMLSIQIVVYIVTTIPQLTSLLYTAIVSNVPNKSSDRLAMEQFASYLGELIVYLFPVSSFYIYSLVSRTYRMELIKLLRRIRFFCTRQGGPHVVPELNAITPSQNLVNRGSTTQVARSLFVARHT